MASNSSNLDWFRVPPRASRARGHFRIAAIAVLLAAGALLGAGTMHVIDVDKWKDAGDTARSVAGSEHRDPRARKEAIFVMQRDICAGIKLLRQIENAESDVGRSARNALLHVESVYR